MEKREHEDEVREWRRGCMRMRLEDGDVRV